MSTNKYDEHKIYGKPSVIYGLITGLFVFFCVFILAFPLMVLDSIYHLITGRKCNNVIKIPLKLLLKSLSVFCGIEFEFRGLEKLPKTSCLILSKHQSDFETAMYVCGLTNVRTIMRNTLLWLPVWNLFTLYTNSIPISRDKSFKAFNVMLKKIKNALKQGSRVILFPEGTRAKINKKVKYNLGSVKLIKEYPIIPVAMNTGIIWGRTIFAPKRKGCIVIEFLDVFKANPNADLGEVKKAVALALDSGCEKLSNEWLRKNKERK